MGKFKIMTEKLIKKIQCCVFILKKKVNKNKNIKRYICDNTKNQLPVKCIVLHFNIIEFICYVKHFT
jgi:hypothetical protein